jgi:pyruvate-ferredoxin/flavodoxin oxidoreductase
MIDENLVTAHRERALNPDHPIIRGTSQNPDVYFQGRETVNPFYEAVPDIIQAQMDKLAGMTGRQYKLYEYVGAEDAERVILLMGSGIGAAQETVEHMVARGEKVGMIKVRLFRPFSPAHLFAALPVTATKLAVLDRTKEPGADGEPCTRTWSPHWPPRWPPAIWRPCRAWSAGVTGCRRRSSRRP